MCIVQWILLCWYAIKVLSTVVDDAASEKLITWLQAIVITCLAPV